jgi:hypothetical protein
MKYHFLLLLVMTVSSHSYAQLVTDLDDESKLYAQTKQVNQFFRRFNGEEDEKGNRYYSYDKQYRNTKLRKKYLGMLFDETNQGISLTLKTEFTRTLFEGKDTHFLDFHGPEWFAEVQTIFTLNGKENPFTLFMELEQNHLGYKWVIAKVYADIFAAYYKRDTSRIGKFLHPLSHELDFMNLRKAFFDKDSTIQFTEKHFTADQLSVFLYEMKKGNLKFKTVTEVKFHFFQINGWYFELSEFNRPGYNTGWLISNLVKLNSEADKTLLRRFLHHERY